MKTERTWTSRGSRLSIPYRCGTYFHRTFWEQSILSIMGCSISWKWRGLYLMELCMWLRFKFCSWFQIKKLLRETNWPVGHRIRANLWQEICKLNNPDFNAYKGSYKSEGWEEHIGDFSSLFFILLLIVMLNLDCYGWIRQNTPLCSKMYQ